MWRARRLFARFSAFLRPGPADRELAREVAAHLALLEDEFRAKGMGDCDARLAARRAYGGVAHAMELQRDARSFVWLEQALQDARHAWRGLRRSPGFVAVALLSLALGIGVNTAIFTLVHGVLLKRLPVADPERIVQVRAHLRQFDSSGFSYPAFREVRKQHEVFADAIGFNVRPATLEQGEARNPIALEIVTGSYFTFFGARPALGRLLDEEDDRVDGARPVCVISYDLWQSRFGRDARILGRKLRVDGVPLEVVGVAPPEFTGAHLQRRNDVWAPTAMQGDLSKIQRDSPTWIWLSMLGRLKPGVSFAVASARLEAASSSIEAGLPKNRANRAAVYRIVDASKGFDSWRTSLREPLLTLMGAVTLVLLVACANLANLLLARSSERRQEFAIKLSLGVSRWRLMRQLMGETFAVTLAGGLLGIALSAALTRYLLVLFNSGNRFQQLHVTPDAAVLAYTFAGCAATALAAGLYPAWQASRTDVARPLASGAANLRRAWVRRALILAQVTLAVVLLFGASLFAHSLRNLKRMPLGIDIERVLSVEVKDSTPGKQARRVLASPVLAGVLARVRQLPGVESAAFSHPGPFSGSGMSTDAEVAGPGGVRRTEEFHVMMVSPGFLSTLRLPLVRGRDFTPADRAGAPPVVIVNQQLAAAVWPGEDPIGKHINGWSLKDAEVVGVVANSHYRAVREATLSIMYSPFDQEKVEGGTLEIRCRGPLSAIEREVRRIVRADAPGYVAGDSAAMTLLRDGIIAQDRLLAFLSTIFGALGTALALVGIYGLISYSVTRRTREVGIRMSVGAQRSDVLWLFLRESMALLALGVAAGLPLAIVLARFIRKMLYQVSTSEPRDLAITVLCLAAGGVVAAYLPGRRATRIDPVRALRYD